jgi:hypothetical protein
VINSMHGCSIAYENDGRVVEEVSPIKLNAPLVACQKQLEQFIEASTFNLEILTRILRSASAAPRSPPSQSHESLIFSRILSNIVRTGWYGMGWESNDSNWMGWHWM